jgi:hypothetical protein
MESNAFLEDTLQYHMQDSRLRGPYCHSNVAIISEVPVSAMLILLMVEN